jgi:hypothetical protein
MVINQAARRRDGNALAFLLAERYAKKSNTIFVLSKVHLPSPPCDDSGLCSLCQCQQERDERPKRNANGAKTNLHNPRINYWMEPSAIGSFVSLRALLRTAQSAKHRSNVA